MFAVMAERKTVLWSGFGFVCRTDRVEKDHDYSMTVYMSIFM